MPDERTDEDLVEAANRGEREAFAALYERHRGFVHAVAWRLTGDAELAADVTQETFLWWLSRFPGFTLSGKATTFLYQVARSVSIDCARRARRTLRMPDDGEAVPSTLSSTSPFDAAEADERAALAAVVGALPFGQQETLLLRFGCGLSLQEVAQALGVPLGTVKSRLHLALRALEEAPQLAALRRAPDAASEQRRPGAAMP